MKKCNVLYKAISDAMQDINERLHGLQTSYIEHEKMLDDINKGRVNKVEIPGVKNAKIVRTPREVREIKFDTIRRMNRFKEEIERLKEYQSELYDAKIDLAQCVCRGYIIQRNKARREYKLGSLTR